MFDREGWVETPTKAKEPKVIQNRRELSRMLRNRQEWEERWEWRFSELDCGSAGCAVGLWAKVKKADEPWEDLGACLFSGANNSELRSFLIANEFGPHPAYGVPMEEVTPLMVADKIDAYIEQHVNSRT